MTALQGLRAKGGFKPGERVLVNCASGGVGTFAVQLGKVLGGNVTAVCSSRNLELSRSLGADQVIDYSREDFTQGVQRYDLILAANGYHRLKDYKRALAPGGRFLMTGGSGKQMAEAILFGPIATFVSYMVLQQTSKARRSKSCPSPTATGQRLFRQSFHGLPQ